MELSFKEQAMLRGEMGEPVRNALKLQLEVGKFYGARRFVRVKNVHMMGDIEVMGDSGLEYLRCTREKRAHCSVDITTNARCADFAHAEALGQDMGEIAKERTLIGYLADMNVMTTDTCINYQTLYQPHLGEHVAWGDTGTVIYANSVFGARSNFEAGPAALAAGLTGRTPEYGFHLDEHRRGTFVVKVDATLGDFAGWGALGKIVGESHQDYFSVPVFDGIGSAPTSDGFKHLGASLASYGSMAMFHMVGVTPEAPTVEQALGGRTSAETMTVRQADIDAVFRRYDIGDGRCNLVVFSGPQQSLFEMKCLAELFAGKRVHPGSRVFVTTAHSILADARRLGYAQALEAAGVTILAGVCFYILQNLSQMRIANGWANLVSNSAKLVNTITAHRFNTILRRTAECVEVAVSGVVK